MDTILVIDDSWLVQAQLKDILSGSFNVLSAEDGPKGLAVAAEHAPDLILLDIHLPEMNGYDVCRSLRAGENAARVPILFITALSAEQERVEGFAAGGDDYIIKPFYPEELVARIKVHLASRRAHEQQIELERLKLFQEMAVALSHEINNPLTALYGCLYILERGHSAAEASTAVEGLRGELDRIRDIVRKFRDASRITTITYHEHSKMIDLHEL